MDAGNVDELVLKIIIGGIIRAEILKFYRLENVWEWWIDLEELHDRQ